MISNEEVLSVLFDTMPAAERSVLCTVAGDPSTVERWPGIPWRLGGRCPLLPSRNNYVTVSSFHANERGEWRRRKDHFAKLYAIMVDDIGTKIDASSLPPILSPTLLVETSPGNYQATFKLRTPLEDLDLADGLIRRMIEVLAPGGVDPGMAGVTRVMRLPVGVNGKPKYVNAAGDIWSCKVARWKPEKTMDFDELAHAFSLVKKVRVYVEPNDGVTVERKRGFALVLQGLQELGRIKRRGRWVDIRCPWVMEHTDRSDTGSAVAFPENANGWYGGFRCHHGHCQGRGWADIEAWVQEQVVRQGRATAGPLQ